MAPEEISPGEFSQLVTRYLESNDDAEKKKFLDLECGDDEELRSSILKEARNREEDTLAVRDQDAETIASSTPPSSRRGSESSHSNDTKPAIAVSAKPGNQQIGTKIGAYRILKVLGEGGFGIVYKAEQLEPVNRMVALKVIKPGMDSAEVISRFAAERQALALMDHPNIARVYDAGTGESGHPYFVMELCSGIPLTEYCDQNELDAKERITLFLSVCRAVQHAHQKAIIHRDLKPSNILVSEQDGRPVPKVIDFGIAKALNQELTSRSLQTGVGMVIGTPQYMSPEQAAAIPDDIDTRSDVYSLGTILYELLTGSTPLAPETLRKAAVDEILRFVREKEALRPSSLIWQQGETEKGDATAATRQSDPRRLSRTVRGELDWIIMKALEKEMERRYESVADLAGDIERYLNGEAVTASPPSVTYRMRKFARRHRGPLAAAASLALALIAGTIVSVDQAIRANEARREAQTVAEFLITAFQSPDPYREGSEIKVVEILDEAAARVKEEFVDDPGIRSRLLDTIGQTYSGLGLDKTALGLHRSNADLLLSLHGEQDPRTVRAEYRFGTALWNMGRYPEAIAILEKTSGLSQSIHGKKSPNTLDVNQSLANAHMFAGNYDVAIPLHQKNIELQVEVMGAEHEGTLAAMQNLGSAYYLAGDYSNAKEWYQKVLESRRRTEAPRSLRLAESLGNLAMVYNQLEQLEEALDLHREALEIKRERFGDDHLLTLDERIGLALVLSKKGEFELAMKHLEESVAVMKESPGLGHPRTLVAIRNLAIIYGEVGRVEDSVSQQKLAYEGSRELYGPDHPDSLASLNSLANALAQAERFDEAEKTYLDVLKTSARVRGEADTETLRVRQNLVALYFDDLERKDEAMVIQEEGWKIHQKHFGRDHPRTLLAQSQLARGFGVLGNHERAVQLLEPIYEALREAWPQHWELPQAGLCLATAYRETGRAIDAEPLFLATMDLVQAQYESNPNAYRPVQPLRVAREAVAHYRLEKDAEKVSEWREQLEKWKKRRTADQEILSKQAPPRDPKTREMTLRVQVDGTSFLFVSKDSLWLSHENGKGLPPGRQGGNFPTSVDRRDWMPVWKEKVTEPLRLVSPLPVDQEGFSFYLEHLTGRGIVTVEEQPSPENDFTGKLRLSDETEDGSRFLGAEWLAFKIKW